MRALYFDCSAGMKALYESAPGMADFLPSLNFHIGDPDPAALPDLLAGSTGVLNGHTKMSAELLDALPDLKVIVFLGTGVASYVDMEAAAARGIAAYGIAGYGNRTIAEHTLALMLAGVRRVARLDREMRAGTWRPDSSNRRAYRAFSTVRAVLISETSRPMMSPCSVAGISRMASTTWRVTATPGAVTSSKLASVGGVAPLTRFASSVVTVADSL